MKRSSANVITYLFLPAHWRGLRLTARGFMAV
ncbi:MAG: hypothetical protein KatS3mg055_2684 [Chloroflexus sp.]|nr:MAG: hypothetical protein KatS3mg055_2684 [Chloroflexus sp.]